MAVRPIVTFPDPVLKQRCAPVTEFGPALHSLLDDLGHTMQAADGIGLAANQVGAAVRALVIDVPLRDDRQAGPDGAVETTGLIEVVNPRITAMRGDMKYEEGCLSFPGVREYVTRASEIDLEFMDRMGRTCTVQAQGLVAVCIQHEMDHLEGITFLDRLSPLKRRVVMREYLRTQAAEAEERQRRARAAARRAATE
ncbi:MAG: peptide deformylase [Myxococcales bacterium]|nr:peptide deformylase [Myxococcales bacterium]